MLLFTRATGVAAALGGAYTCTYPHLLDPTSGLFSGRQKITTSDGSTMLVLLTGRAIPKQDPKTQQASSTEFALTSMVGTVEGGTGKFANASGKYTGAGEASLATLQVSATFKGRVTVAAG